MLTRSLALLAFALTPLAVHAADDDNPFRKAKVGDYAKYSGAFQTGSFGRGFVRVQTVVAVNERELTLRTNPVYEGKELPTKTPDQKIDLTKPFNAATTDDANANLVKWDKQKSGTDKLKVGNTEYDCTWTTYKAVSANPNTEVTGELKVWMSKDVPFVMKRTLKMTVGTVEIVYEMEMIELGNKK